MSDPILNPDHGWPYHTTLCDDPVPGTRCDPYPGT